MLNNAPMFAAQNTASHVPSQGVVLNEENFPDPKFREYIQAYTGISQGNLISPEQCEKITELYDEIRETEVLSVQSYLNLHNLDKKTHFKGIKSLQGIEYFPNMKVIRLHGFMGSAIDVSTHKKLEELILVGATSLSSLTLGDKPNLHRLQVAADYVVTDDEPRTHVPLEHLDLSGAPQLNHLYLTGTSIQELDISRNELLLEFYADHSPLKKIDLTSAYYLRDVRMSGTKLQTLDLSQNGKLEYLRANNNQLSDIVFPKHNMLKEVYLTHNKLTHLDISNFSSLKKIDCYGNPLLTLNAPEHYEFLLNEAIIERPDNARYETASKKLYIPTHSYTPHRAYAHFNAERNRYEIDIRSLFGDNFSRIQKQQDGYFTSIYKGGWGYDAEAGCLYFENTEHISSLQPNENNIRFLYDSKQQETEGMRWAQQESAKGNSEAIPYTPIREFSIYPRAFNLPFITDKVKVGSLDNLTEQEQQAVWELLCRDNSGLEDIAHAEFKGASIYVVYRSGQRAHIHTSDVAMFDEEKLNEQNKKKLAEALARAQTSARERIEKLTHISQDTKNNFLERVDGATTPEFSHACAATAEKVDGHIAHIQDLSHISDSQKTDFIRDIEADIAQHSLSEISTQAQTKEEEAKKLDKAIKDARTRGIQQVDAKFETLKQELAKPLYQTLTEAEREDILRELTEIHKEATQAIPQSFDTQQIAQTSQKACEGMDTLVSLVKEKLLAIAAIEEAAKTQKQHIHAHRFADDAAKKMAAEALAARVSLAIARISSAVHKESIATIKDEALRDIQAIQPTSQEPDATKQKLETLKNKKLTEIDRISYDDATEEEKEEIRNRVGDLHISAVASIEHSTDIHHLARVYSDIERSYKLITPEFSIKKRAKELIEGLQHLAQAEKERLCAKVVKDIHNLDVRKTTLEARLLDAEANRHAYADSDTHKDATDAEKEAFKKLITHQVEAALQSLEQVTKDEEADVAEAVITKILEQTPVYTPKDHAQPTPPAPAPADPAPSRPQEGGAQSGNAPQQQATPSPDETLTPTEDGHAQSRDNRREPRKISRGRKAQRAIPQTSDMVGNASFIGLFGATLVALARKFRR